MKKLIFHAFYSFLSNVEPMVDLCFLRMMRKVERRLGDDDAPSVSELQEGCTGYGEHKTSFLGDRRGFFDDDFSIRSSTVDVESSIEEFLRCLLLWWLCSFECLWGDLVVAFCLEFFCGFPSSDLWKWTESD